MTAAGYAAMLEFLLGNTQSDPRQDLRNADMFRLPVAPGGVAAISKGRGRGSRGRGRGRGPGKVGQQRPAPMQTSKRAKHALVHASPGEPQSIHQQVGQSQVVDLLSDASGDDSGAATTSFSRAGLEDELGMEPEPLCFH